MAKEEKVTKLFEQRIQQWLDEECRKDPLFEEKVVNSKKTVQGACNYVLKCAKESRQCGYDDAEVYGMVRHFFDEDDVKDPGDQHPGRIVVTGHVELSDVEKAEAMAKAQEAYLEEIRKAEAEKAAKAEEERRKAEDERRQRLEEKRQREARMQGDLFGGM